MNRRVRAGIRRPLYEPGPNTAFFLVFVPVTAANVAVVLHLLTGWF